MAEALMWLGMPIGVVLVVLLVLWNRKVEADARALREMRWELEQANLREQRLLREAGFDRRQTD
ncbi:hypothetical protein UFOVP706_48 [uncultured Caudovirales phage]|uniref:Uncharacterized protein n=1 Tax=uncultured Caudovirales phage TaxID=2100421 RepID=A0A6J5NJX0_9CAUD|nr:hypothetical protein UFOVP706_48 [uncultured Caudovirales phage]